MSKKNVNFEWYVLNEVRYVNDERRGYPYPSGKVIPWNIFSNSCVYEWTIKACEDYKRKHWTFDKFVEELRLITQNQLWSRIEYEIDVKPHFSDKEEDLERIDCYQQVLPNIRILAKHVLETYYPKTPNIDKQ